MSDKVLVQPRFTRICHWSFALCMLMLLASGYYIHYPVNLGSLYDMKSNVLLKAVFGFIAVGIFTAWVYHHIVTQAYKDIILRSRDLRDMVGLLRYYLFIEKKPPVHGKYNAGQRLIYSSWVPAFLFMFLTGVILYLANFGSILPLPLPLQKVRFYHFLVSLWFLGTVPVHIYLVLTEDPAKLQAMFTGWIRKPPK